MGLRLLKHLGKHLVMDKLKVMHLLKHWVTLTVTPILIRMGKQMDWVKVKVRRLPK
jgi:hypothetical protein